MGVYKKMASTMTTFESFHQDMIHDTQPDYYGTRLATCSSDRLIKIFDITSKQPKAIAELAGHSGPVWQVSWAHPKFGSMLASCGYDRKVIIWKEGQNNLWTPVKEYTGHSSSVNSVAWAPHEYGLVLACASSDGHISVISYQGDTWNETKFHGHTGGCTSVSWCPYLKPGALFGVVEGANPKRIVTGGCDNTARVWQFDESDKTWKPESNGVLTGHQDWVRDVAWAPNIGLPVSTVATCSQDRKCFIWTQSENSDWKKTELPQFPAPVWRVSWSITGNILAVSTGDNRVTLWKENTDGEWTIVSAVTENGVSEN
eukprot:c16260_g1_i1.p1 GENE.c16260_g1_i1~~c16260_g1_i1.p1  ORF type:complete len:315 (+),score=121.27 c16260_g1_i1:1-945(+)